MKAIIVIHSQSGHTVALARAIGEELRKSGHEVDIELLRIRGAAKPGSSNFELRNAPDVSSYDMVLVGGPVWGFSASPVVMKFLRDLDGLKGKKAVAFATKGLPFQWTGGVQALRKMMESLELSGADVVEGEAVWYFFSGNQARIDQAAQRITERLKQ